MCLSVCSKCLSVALSHPVRPVLGLTSDRQLSFDRRKTTRATDQLMERKPTVETLNTCSVFNCRAGHATTRPCFQAKRMVEYCLMSIFVLATLFTHQGLKIVHIVLLSLMLNYVFSLSLSRSLQNCRVLSIFFARTISVLALFIM